MKICFNQATTMKSSSLVQDLILCEKNEYDLIEIRLDKLQEYLKTHSLNELITFFKKNKIKPYAFNALEFITFRSPDDYSKIKETLRFLCKVGNEINCKKIVVVPTFDVGDYTVSQIKDETVKILKELSDLARPFSMKLAFEFVGYPNCSVNTFGQAYEIVAEVNRENVGIVLDCFHFYAMGSKISDLEKADPKKIFIFHIDDAEDYPIGFLRDDKRVWPGYGVINLDEILSTLKKIGYQEMASVELFRPEYWNWDIAHTIKTGKEATESVICKYF